MTDVTQLLKDIDNLSPEDKEKIASACRGAKVKAEDGVGMFTCGPNSQAQISPFSGDGTKGEVSFLQWRFEVHGMLRDEIYPERVILQTLRRSLCGTAADVLLHMGESVTIENVIDKMDKIFGNILPTEAVLEQFYIAKQLPSESVAVWACRLEDILWKLKDNRKSSSSSEGGQSNSDTMTPFFSPDVAKYMLRTKFYSGCLKNALRHNFDGGSDYDALLVAARVADLEEEQEKKATVRVHQSAVVDSGMAAKLDKVLASLESMQSRINNLASRDRNCTQTKPQTRNNNRRFTGHCYGCGQQGHIKTRCPLNSQKPAAGGGQQAKQAQAPKRK